MKQIFFFGIMLLILGSCQDKNSIDEPEMDTSIVQEPVNQDSVFQEDSKVNEHEFSALADENPTKRHFESLLNSYYEDFEEIAFGEIAFESSELVHGFTQFRTVDTKTSVKFFFADHQDNLITFAKDNFQEGYYGVNGGGLFLVDGEDEQSMNDILSWFSGEE